jgi:hypothetical protein
MRRAFRVGALALLLAGWIGVALKDALSVEDISQAPWEEAQLLADEEETTGSIDRAAAMRALPLSDEQRGWIFLGVINLPDVPDVDLPAGRHAGALPEDITLHELPAMVTSKIPLVRDYGFVKLDDRILLVRSADRTVAGEIPRYRLGR